MSKDRPELLINVAVDHGDGTATCYVWSDLEPELLDQIKASLGEPEFVNFGKVTYGEETGDPQIDVTVGSDYDLS